MKENSFKYNEKLNIFDQAMLEHFINYENSKPYLLKVIILLTYTIIVDSNRIYFFYF